MVGHQRVMTLPSAHLESSQLQQGLEDECSPEMTSEADVPLSGCYSFSASGGGLERTNKKVVLKEAMKTSELDRHRK